MGVPLPPKKALKWGQEALIRGLHKLDFVEEGHAHSGQLGFPLLLDKSLKWGQEAWIWGLNKLDFVEERHVQSGQVGFPLLLKKALKWSQEACHTSKTAPILYSMHQFC